MRWQRRLAERLAGIDGLRVVPPRDEHRLRRCRAGARQGLVERLKEHGVLATGTYRLRLVTHLGVTAEDVDRAADGVAQALAA